MFDFPLSKKSQMRNLQPLQVFSRRKILVKIYLFVIASVKNAMSPPGAKDLLGQTDNSEQQ